MTEESLNMTNMKTHSLLQVKGAAIDFKTT